MRRFYLGMLILVLAVSFMGCGTNKAWRQATVITYELAGVGVGATKDIGESLNAQGLIKPEQLVKIKDAYNKARAVYITAGNALKLASAASSSAEQGKLLEEYLKLLDQFKTLAYQVYDLVKQFKKVSLLDIEQAIQTGGDV